MNTKFLIPIGIVCACALAAFSQERPSRKDVTDTTRLSVDETTRIIGEVSDGTQVAEQPKPEKPIDFNVIKSHSQQVNVKLAPEMPGLPSPEGMMKLTVELVQKPKLEKAQPMRQIETSPPGLTERIEEQSKDDSATQNLLVSASVYDNSITQFQIQGLGNQNKSISGWSNINFLHFTGFSDFQVKGADGILRHYSLIMAASDVTDPSIKIPGLPGLAANGPTFVLDDGDTNDPSNKQIVEDLHNLYRVEGKRLSEANEARTKAYEERKAYLLANPPKPKDVTVRFWNQETVNPR